MKSKTLTLLVIILTSNLAAHLYADSEPIAPQTEFEQLAVISAKYGNNPRGVPALHYAILENDVDAVDLLLKYGASAYTKSAKSHEADILHVCVQSGNLELFRKFVELGCDIAKNLYASETTLGLAISLHQNDIARFILETSLFDFDENECPVQLLEHCSRYGNYEIFDILLHRYSRLQVDQTRYAKGALARYQVGDGEHHLLQPDLQIVIEGKFKILDRITDYELSVCLADGYEAIHILSNSFSDALAYLLDREILHVNDLVYNTPLLLIASRNWEHGKEMVDALVSRGVNVQEGNSKYALFSAVDGGPFRNQDLERKKALILTLLNAGLDINLLDQRGRSVLELAKDPNIVTYLKGLGAKK